MALCQRRLLNCVVKEVLHVWGVLFLSSCKVLTVHLGVYRLVPLVSSVEGVARGLAQAFESVLTGLETCEKTAIRELASCCLFDSESGTASAPR